MNMPIRKKLTTGYAANLITVVGMGVAIWCHLDANHRDEMKVLISLQINVAQNKQQLNDHETSDNKIHADFGRQLTEFDNRIYLMIQKGVE